MFQPREIIKVSRDVVAIRIPDGTPIPVKVDSQVTITQSLGGSYTIMTEEGYMARISGADADAIGKEVSVSNYNLEKVWSKEEVETSITEQMKTCFDPEIPVNIVELGLIYDSQIYELAPGSFRVAVKMTLTAPGCGMGGTLSADLRNKLLGIPAVKEADVEIVWDPPWTPHRMSEAAKLQLGFL